MAYAAAEDLMLGNVPLPRDGGADKYLTLAAEEIDGEIGARYATPVAVDVTSPTKRQASLLLKKINAWLASGRLLMSADAAGAGDAGGQVQQYGLYLVKEAQAALQQIKDGTIELTGIELANPEANKATGPVASFADSYSLVEGFGAEYGNPAQTVLERPNYLIGNPYTY